MDSWHAQEWRRFREDWREGWYTADVYAWIGRACWFLLGGWLL